MNPPNRYKHLVAALAVTSVMLQPLLAVAQQSQFTFKRVVPSLVVTGSPGNPTTPVTPPSGTPLHGIASISIITMDATPVGATSQKTVSLSNAGNAPLTVSGMSVASGNPPYALVSNTCGAPIAVNQACSITLSFSPLVAGPQVSGSLLIANNGVTGAQAVTINGVGQLPANVIFKNINDEPMASVAFPATSIGAVSAPLTVKLVNPGDLPVTLTEPALTVPAPFSLASTTCSEVLAAHSECSANILFAPTAVQTYSGGSYTLTINSNISGLSLHITGTGVPVGIAQVVVGANSMNVFVQKTNNNWVATGNNGAGQLGIGNSTSQSTFVAVPALNGATTVVTGQSQTFARLASGSWVATGQNTQGQLGIGTFVNQSNFVAVPALDGAIKVVAGGYFTYAQFSNGTWKATGANSDGQLSISSQVNQSSFVAIPALNGATEVVAGSTYAFARLSTGNWVAVGSNNIGQLGLGDYTMRNSFTAVPALNGATTVKVGALHTIAKLSNGLWAGTGNNGDGELGIGTLASQSTFSSIPYLNSNSATQVITGAYHTIAKLANGNWVATGLNSAGTLGINNTTDQASFVGVTGLSGVTAVIPGRAFTLAIQANGSLVGTGLNSSGQLGIGSLTNQKVYTPISP